MHAHGLEAIEAIVEAPREPYRRIRVNPVTPTIGGEIEGVDLSAPIDAETFGEIRRALLDRHVLVFRDQALSGEDHKRFGRMFGRLHVHPLQAMREGDKELLEIRADRDSKRVAGEGWHADVTCDAEPPMGSMLYLDTTPNVGCGGDTLFANMHLAYEMLSPTLQAFLDPLTAVHDGAIPWVQGYGYAPKAEFQRNVHPVVARHPETGRKLLYVNRGFTSHICELERFESAAVLEMLYRHIETQPALSCRVRWTPNTLVFWDNRCTQHQAIWDYYPLGRSGRRVSIIGERPAA